MTNARRRHYSLTHLRTCSLVLLRRQLVLDEVAHVLHGELLAEVLHVRVGFELRQVGERHAFLELGDAGRVDFAVVDVFGVGEDVFGEQLAALDLDVEGLFQAEHDVEEVDRLGAQVALQRGLGRDFVFVDAQRVDQRLLNLGKDFLLSTLPMTSLCVPPNKFAARRGMLAGGRSQAGLAEAIFCIRRKY